MRNQYPHLRDLPAFERRRIGAIYFYLKCRSIPETAMVYNVSQSAVRLWLHRYRTLGFEGLRMSPRYKLNKLEIERVFRDRRLSPEEIARDEEVRRKVQMEFPPTPPSGSPSGRLSQALRDALRTSDKSMYQISQDAGVSQIVVSRFLSGERDIRMATADKLAEALGLMLGKAS